jgi:O-Antigen ligase
MSQRRYCRRVLLARLRRGSVAPWVYASALAWWASSWNLHASVLMAWSPVAPVWIGAGAVALCVVHRCGRPIRVDPSVAWPLVLVVIGFLPGALGSSGEGYGPVKVFTMIFVLLPVVCAATVLLDSHEARRGWVWAQTVVGASVALAALKFHDNPTSIENGRFALETLDTISTARLIGAAVVALALFGLTSLRHCWWALPLAVGSGVVLVHVGSRGPLLFVLVTVLVVVVVGRCFTRHRIVFVVGTIAATVAAYRYAQADGGAGGQRIAAWVQSGLSDAVRVQLINDAVRLGAQHPMGIGWGDFAQKSAVGHEIANAQGVAYAHNSFAEAFCEGGVAALLALAMVVVVALTRLYRRSGDPYEAVVLGTTLYWLLNAQVSSDLVGNRFMWISIAVGVASYADVSRKRPRRVDSGRPAGPEENLSGVNAHAGHAVSSATPLPK